MMSNRCLFNKAIFKSDIKRFLPFTIPLLIVNLIIFPVIIYSNFRSSDYPLELESFSGMSVASDIFNYFFSGLFALLVFSYLYSSNKCNAIHAFPIGRKGLFITNYLAGYILLTVPQLIGFAVAIPGIYITSKQFGAILLLQLVSIFAESFVFYSTGVLAVMLAGNIFAGAVLYIILNTFTLVIESVINVVLTRLGYGLSFSGDFSFGIFSFAPMSEFIAYKVSMIFSSADDLFGVNEITGRAGLLFSNMWGAYYPRIAVLCGVSVVFITLAYVLYKIRKLECAGDMVAFRIEIPIISVIVLFVGGALMSMAVCVFVPFKILGFVLAFILLSFATFIVCQMVLRKSAKVFNVKNIILWAVSCAVIIVGLYALSVYKTNYTPEPEKVEEVQITTSYDIHITDKDEMKAVENFRKELIKNARKNNHKDRDGEDEGLLAWLGDSLFSTNDYSVNFFYKLEDGKVINRFYGFDKKDRELVKMLDELEGKHHPKSVFENLDGINFEITDISVSGYDWYNDNGAGVYPEIPKERYDEVFKACKEYSVKELESYRTEPESEKIVEYDDEEENATVYYNIEFECRVTDAKSKKKLNELEEFMSDPNGVHIELNTEFDDSGWRILDESETFAVRMFDVSSDSEIIDVLSSFDTSKSAA